MYLPIYSRPTEEEKAAYNEAQAFLEESAIILDKLRDYRGATKEIRYQNSEFVIVSALSIHTTGLGICSQTWVELTSVSEFPGSWALTLATFCPGRMWNIPNISQPNPRPNHGP